MAADAVFLDTCLIVAASVDAHPSHSSASSYAVKLVGDDVPLCISPQVCREFIVTLTRKPIGGKIYAIEEALGALQQWRQACTLLEETDAVVDHWKALLERYQVRGKQVHDANIVAVMKAYGVKRLATRNAADFQRYDDEISIEPFVG